MGLSNGHKQVPGSCRAAWICVALLATHSVAQRGFCDSGAGRPILAVIATPVGTGPEAELARSLVPEAQADRYELRSIRALGGVTASSEAGAIEDSAAETVRQAEQAALSFDLVLAAQLRRRAADHLLSSELLALDPSLVAVHLLEAGAASVAAAERDVALLYFRKALAVDGDITPGPLISPEAKRVFEAARAQGPSYFANPHDRTLRRLCASLGIQGVLWISVGRDDGGLVVSEKLLLMSETSSKLDTRHYSASEGDLEKWIAQERQRLRTVVNLHLQPEPEVAAIEPDKPWYRKWWVYAVAGAVIAAGATGVVIATAMAPAEVDVVVHH